MSQAENLLDSLSAAEIAAYSAGATEEPHVVIGSDRYITVPDSLKRIAVERDKDVETVTFACPRYWDKHDLSEMIIYINYRLPDKTEGGYIATNLVVEDDMIYFDWTIGIEITQSKGNLAFIVCASKTDADGNVDVRWHSELNTDMYVSEGMECISGFVESEYPDIVTQLLERMTVNESYYAEMQGLISSAQTSATNAAKSETNAAASESKVIEVQADIDNSAAEIRNSYANAIKGNVSGEIIRVNDVSPLEHEVNCVVHGKNLFDISKITSTSSATNNGDGTITIAANTYYCRLNQTLREVCPYLKAGDVAVLSFDSDSAATKYMYFHGLQGTWNVNNYITLTDGILDSYVTIYGYAEGNDGYGQECVISNIQIELGKIPTAYEPYIDQTAVTIIASGKNFWHSKNLSYPRTVSGVTIDYDPKTQIYTFNGTSTSPGDIYIAPNNTHIMRINSGETWTLKVEVMGGTIDGVATSSGKMSPLVNTSDYTNTIHANHESLYAVKTYTEPADVTKMYFYVYAAGIVFNNFKCRVQFEMNNKPTEFEKSKGLVTGTMSLTDIAAAVKSFSPNMIIKTDTPGAIIEAEYNRDTTKMFESYVLTEKAKSEIAGLVKADISAEIDAIESSLDEIIAIQESLV